MLFRLFFIDLRKEAFANIVQRRNELDDLAHFIVLRNFFRGAEDNDENNFHQSSPKGLSKMGSPELEVIHTLPHPPYNPDLSPCDLFLFPKAQNQPQRTSY